MSTCIVRSCNEPQHGYRVCSGHLRRFMAHEATVPEQLDALRFAYPGESQGERMARVAALMPDQYPDFEAGVLAAAPADDVQLPLREEAVGRSR